MNIGKVIAGIIQGAAGVLMVYLAYQLLLTDFVSFHFFAVGCGVLGICMILAGVAVVIDGVYPQFYDK